MRSLKKLVLPLVALLLCGCQAGHQASQSARHTSAVTAKNPAASTAPSPTPRSKLKPVTIKRFQRILAKDGFPVGPADGKAGARTQQGTCAFRRVMNENASRKPPTRYERRYAPMIAAKLPLPTNHTALVIRAGHLRRGILVDQTCQAAYLILHRQLVRVIPVSTGGHYQYFNQQSKSEEWADTPNGSFHLSYRWPGLQISQAVPDGQMWYPWYFYDGAALHGEVDPAAIPPYPASHGCVRMSMNNIHYIWNHYQRNDPVLVFGRY